ncbi:hypothetical protein Tco_1037014 [Tanacetum coccineum]
MLWRNRKRLSIRRRLRNRLMFWKKPVTVVFKDKATLKNPAVWRRVGPDASKLNAQFEKSVVKPAVKPAVKRAVKAALKPALVNGYMRVKKVKSKVVAGLKGEIYLDVVRRLREDSDISKIDCCGYIHSCLEDSEIQKKLTVQYLGPFLFLILLYFDSTKFDGFPIIRTRPTIRAWNSTLMSQREKLELKEHVLGLLELHDESTGGGSMLTTEKEV